MIYTRLYWKEYAVWFALFMAAMVMVKKLSHWFPDDSPFRLLLIVLPTLAAFGGFWVELRNLRRIDELQRRIYLESLFVGQVFLVAFCVAAAMAELVIGLPRFSPLAYVFAQAAGSGIGLLVARQRYR
jgi:predicted neutral ceramidase superfamily lipid hydrolase